MHGDKHDMLLKIETSPSLHLNIDKYALSMKIHGGT